MKPHVEPIMPNVRLAGVKVYGAGGGGKGEIAAKVAGKKQATCRSPAARSSGSSSLQRARAAGQRG